MRDTAHRDPFCNPAQGCGLTPKPKATSSDGTAVASGCRETRADHVVTDHATWIKACAAGDKSALQALMTAEGGRMFGVAQRMLRRIDLAEDAVQDAFVLIWKRSHQFDPSRGSARGWVYTILRNRCLTMLRNEDRVQPIGPEAMESAINDQDLDTAFDRLDQTDDLRRCLERLDLQTRRAILSSYVLGHSHGEIAGRMAAPLGSVKSWVRRGLTKLRECLS